MHTALGDRDRDIDFLMRSSPYGSVSHGHADQNAFVINAFGRSLAIATGYYPWYGSPHHHQWTRATRSVNSILVDGQGQVQRSSSAQGRITAFVSNDGYDYTEGEAGPAYGKKLKRFRRHVVHVKPGVFVMFDDLEATKPATFQWLLHAYEKIGVEESSRTLRVNRDPAAMEVRFLLPSALSFSQTDQYEPDVERIRHPDAKNTWHLTAGTTEPSATMQFVTVLLPYRNGNEASLPKAELARDDGALTVKLTSPDGSQDSITFGPRVSARGVKKDGSVSRRLSVEGVK
jgi:hypothetical protein